MSRADILGDLHIVQFVPGQPAPWDGRSDSESLTDSSAEARLVTWSLDGLVGAYMGLRDSDGATFGARFPDGTCYISVRAMEKAFGVHLLGFIQALGQGPRFAIQLDSETRSALVAHWTRMIPGDMEYRELRIHRAAEYAVLGVRQLFSVIAQSLESIGNGPQHYSESVIEGVPPLPIALLDHRYKAAHAEARRALERVRMDIAKQAILLLHPDVSPDVSCALEMPFEPGDPDEML